MSWVLGDTRLDGASRWHIFQSMFRSKVSYAANLITALDNESMKWMSSFWYRSLKALLSIKDKVDSNKLLEVCLGAKFEIWQA